MYGNVVWKRIITKTEHPIAGNISNLIHYDKKVVTCKYATNIGSWKVLRFFFVDHMSGSAQSWWINQSKKNRNVF